ncbi:MAG: hypothetical protein AAF581_07290 [Planctomycetota bacterium]
MKLLGISISVGLIVVSSCALLPVSVPRACADGVTAPALQRLQQLSAADWRVREAASQWLVANPEQWARSLPHDWEPTAGAEPARAEALWRLRSIQSELAALENLPADVAVLPWGQLCWQLDELLRRHPERATAALRRALASTFQRVRQRAVELTERVPKEVRVELLLPLEQDTSDWVRHSVYQVLERTAPSVARAMLERTLRRHESVALTREAILATNRVGVTPQLADLIRRKWERQDSSIRRAIATVLIRLRRIEDRVVWHWALLHCEPGLARQALAALEDAPGPDDVEAVVPLLERSELELRGRAAQWLATYGGRSHARLIVAHVESADRELVRLALGILGSWNALDTIPNVEETLARIRVPSEWLKPPRGGAWMEAVATETGTPRPAIAPGTLRDAAPRRPRQRRD